MLSTVLYYELAMKVPIPVGITVYLLTWGLGHLRCLVLFKFCTLTILYLFYLGNWGSDYDWSPPPTKLYLDLLKDWRENGCTNRYIENGVMMRLNDRSAQFSHPTNTNFV